MGHTKACTKCQKFFPATIDFFYKSPRNKYGVSSCCRVCKRKCNREYCAVPEVKKRRREKQKKYEQDNREKINARKRKLDRSEYLKEYYSNSENRERRNKYSREHYHANKEYYKEHKRKHFQQNKYEYYARGAKRRIKERIHLSDYANISLITQIYENCPEGYHVDHMIPLANGGVHYESNLCYLPAGINTAKGAKSIEEFGLDVFNHHVIYWQDVLS